MHSQDSRTANESTRKQVARLADPRGKCVDAHDRGHMSRRLLALVAICCLLLAACTAAPTPIPSRSASASRSVIASGSGAASGSPSPAAAARHDWLIVLENKDYSSVIGSADAPYLTSLAHQYALASNYHGVDHPSQPNYMALFSGSTQGIGDDSVYNVDAPNLADQLEHAGLSWRVYAENVPPNCFLGATARGGTDGKGTYARKHNPAISFSSISRDPQRCANITDFSHFDAGAANFSLIVPNQCHDMHDCPVADGDTWLRSFLPKITDSAAYDDGGLVLITFDEEHGRGGANKVATIAISPSIREGTDSAQRYDHYSLLRTVQQLFGLPCLAKSCDATPMTDLLGG
jgi:acid phosphatase